MLSQFRFKTLLFVGLLFLMIAPLVYAPPAPAAAQDSAPGEAPGALSQHTIEFDGLTRSYALYVPSGYDAEADTPMPLVMALHPFASSGQALAALSGLNAQAEEHGFVVAYPDAYELVWEHGIAAINYLSLLAHPDDVGFINALRAALIDEYALDAENVYLTGLAGGGEMVMRMACTTPENYAAVAVVNSLVWNYNALACPDEQPAPIDVLLLLGSENADNPLRGRTEQPQLRDGGILTLQAYNVMQSALFWARRNDCNLRVPRGVNYENYAFEDCPSGASVYSYILEGVGNTWPRRGEDYALNQWGVDAGEIVSAYFFGEISEEMVTAAPAPNVEIYGGAPRGYVLYVPPGYDPDQPTPLVVILHGRPGTAGGMAYLSDFNTVAARENFIALYPEGSLVTDDGRGREWNYTDGAPGYELYKDVDDVEYLGLLIDDLALDLNIDRERVYATGFSNGGFMTQRLACSAPDEYAAFAEVGSALFPYFEVVCDQQPPVPLLMMHGTADVSVPWEGTEFGGEVLSISVPETAIFWAIHNQCDPNAIELDEVPPADPDALTRVYDYLFTDCAPHATLRYIVIEGGGHNLPGVPERLEEAIAGQVNTDIHAASVIWDFFTEYTLSDGEDAEAGETEDGDVEPQDADAQEADAEAADAE